MDVPISLGPVSKLEHGIIDDVVIFISGSCTCEIKNDNPGYDISLGVDWYPSVFGDDITFAQHDAPDERLVVHLLNPNTITDQAQEVIAGRMYDGTSEEPLVDFFGRSDEEIKNADQK